MSHAATQAAILAGKYHGNGPHYEKHVKPLCEASRREQAAAAARSAKAARPRRASAPYGDTCQGMRVLPEEIAALGEP